jgi:hypothetical protein
VLEFPLSGAAQLDFLQIRKTPPAAAEPGPGPARPASLFRFFVLIADFLERNEKVLWWIHSAYALLLGMVVMWLGARNFHFLRVVIFDIAFIWISSLFLPAIAGSTRLSPKWQARVRLIVNYFNKNFYQQLLFFVLPIYFSSATFGSGNMLFVLLLALSAVLSTMDVVYDRYLSVRWPLTALFFAFNLFACINVMLPVLWSVSNYWALWISGALALAGFATILYRWSGWTGPSQRVTVVVAAFALAVLIFFLRQFIPPAPLSIGHAEFGNGIRGLSISGPVEILPSPGSGKIFALTSIKAPLGLLEKVRHIWYLDGKLLYASPYYEVTGGRNDGYRIWTNITWKESMKGQELTLDIETRGGQLIGRTRLSR